VISSNRRRGVLLVLVVLPDGSRSLIPASRTDWNAEQAMVVLTSFAVLAAQIFSIMRPCRVANRQGTENCFSSARLDQALP
jgi:hypothetical protein